MQESFHTSDQLKKSSTKKNLEFLHTTEAWGRVAQYNPMFAEVWHTVEVLAKRIGITESEVFKVMSVILSNANATLSDILVSNGDLAFADFLNMDMPVGFEAFAEFQPGEYQYQKALIKIILESGVTSSRPLVDEWKLNIDLPDIVDRGRINLAVGVNRILFSRTFTFIPELSFTVITAGASLSNISIDLLGVTLTSNIASTVSWTANGC